MFDNVFKCLRKYSLDGFPLATLQILDGTSSVWTEWKKRKSLEFFLSFISGNALLEYAFSVVLCEEDPSSRKQIRKSASPYFSSIDTVSGTNTW